MAKNKLTDLNDHLFETIERLNDNEQMEKHGDAEIERAKAIATIGKVIVENGQLMLNAQKHADEYGYGYGNDRELPKVLTDDTRKGR